MNNKKLLICWIMFSVLLSGCASLNEQFIKSRESKVNLMDGVSKAEAVTIAQNALLKSGYYKDKYIVGSPIVNYNAVSQVWNITFKKQKGFNDNCQFRCIIDRATTEMYCGCTIGYR